VRELVRASRVVGWRRLLELRRAQKQVWPPLINGFVLTRTVQALLNVGFFDEVQQTGTVNIDAFAAAQGLDGEILRSLCEALYASRILDRSEAGYSLTRQGRTMVTTGRGWFEGVYGYEPVYHALEQLLRKEAVYGVDVSRLPDHIARGSAAAEALLYFPLAVDVIRRGGYKHVLDLGCGEGTFLREACGALPGLRASGFDLSAVAVGAGQERLRAAGLEGRITMLVKDVMMLTEAPPELREVDVATIFFVLHELLYGGEARVLAFLRQFRAAFPGVPLMVFEADRPTAHVMRRRPGMAIPYFLQHDLSNQRAVARGQWRSILNKAGFSRIEERNLAFAKSTIFILR
jgi:SAM-dependent methyltransferase